MSDFKLKNVTTPGYKPPKTWEEVAGLERPQRILAARYFLRQAAIRLHQDAGLHPDDVKMLFDAVPEWIDHQQHAHKREQAELRKVWVCRVEGCQYRGTKSEFFKSQEQLTLLDEMPMARCPECGQCDAEECVDDGCIHTYERDGLRCDKCGMLRPGTKAFQVGPSDLAVGPASQEKPGDGKADSCDCEGQKCPICQGMQVPADEIPLIKDHYCSRCNTTFCPNCHGVKTAQLARAYGEVRRCKCGG